MRTQAVARSKRQKRLLENEEYRVLKKGKRYLVADYEKCLVEV